MSALTLALALFGGSSSSAQSTVTAPVNPAGTAPARSKAAPTGTLPAGTTRTDISLATSQNATCRYATKAGTAYSAMTATFGKTGGTEHSTQVKGLANGGRYTYYTRCRAANGTVNADDFPITFNVATASGSPTNPGSPGADTSPPTVVVTAPLNGATVAGTITIKASATDKTAIASVTFQVDGATIGTDTTSPYSVNWNTSSLAPGSHTIRAQARDSAGNIGTSRTVTVTVEGDRPAASPAKAIFTPSIPDTGVTNYVLDIFRGGTALTTPVATQNLGKPRVTGGEIEVDISRTLSSLSNGTYVATVTAVAPGQRARSEPSPSFVIRSGGLTGLSALLAPDTVESPVDPRQPMGDRESVAAADADEQHGTLWVTDPLTSLVSALDAATGDVRAVLPVGLRPMGIVAPPGLDKVYVADEGSDTVSVISTATMDVVATIPLPAPSGRLPHHVSASPDGRFVYVAERGSNVVNVIDTATDQVSARFAAGWPGSKTVAVVPDPGGELLYAVNRGIAPAPSTLSALDRNTGRVQWQLHIDDPGHFLVAPDGRTGLLLHDATGTITRIDLEGRAVVNEINLGVRGEVDAFQISDNGRYLVATLRTAADVIVVDLEETASARMVPLRAPASVTAPAAAEPLYIPVSDSAESPAGVTMLDAAGQRVVRHFRLPGGGAPHAVVFDPR
jgi:YVTN family beta-propeller protein